ncbi:MAG TPA: chemotaxis protein chel [Rhodobacteraceae bacterium]|nr:chemotaxis protein chel [Paracoccaceae bacterium]
MTTITNPALGIPAGPIERETPRDAALMKAAKEMEASFLSEMLKSAGLGKPRESFGGGIGEEQFGSFLRQEQAKAMVEKGGIGLAESLFEAMKEQADAR